MISNLGGVVKKTLLGTGCVAALYGFSLLAQDSIRGTQTVHTAEKAAVHTPAQKPAGLVKIYSNLGSATDAYNDVAGELVSGPATGFMEFLGLPFTPKSDAHVSAIAVAVQYYGSGANQVRLSLYSDAAGVPGTILAGPKTIVNLPDAGTCCALAVWMLKASIPVTAGTQYWIVADTPSSGTGDDFKGAWDFIFPTPFLQAVNTGQGWNQSTGGEELLAGEVMGTTP
jgi:hypothetical protein